MSSCLARQFESCSPGFSQLRRYASHLGRAIVALANQPDFREFDRDESMQSDGKSMSSAESARYRREKRLGTTLLSFAYTIEVSKYHSLELAISPGSSEVRPWRETAPPSATRRRNLRSLHSAARPWPRSPWR